MNPSEKDTCKRCGALIPDKSTADLCPACLMSGALKQPDPDEMVTPLPLGESPAPDTSPPHCSAGRFPREFGGYRLLGLLGRGGMGTVYEAEQIATGRRVALKLLEQQLDSPDMRKRFLREGRLAAGVSHPNSLYIFGSEEIEGVPAITMEIAGSGTLKDKLKKRGPLPVPEAVDAILDIIAGLESAFTAGILHRDIKPSNCFVSPDGSAKIGDFGLSVSTLARDDSYATATGVIMGTPAYASPEQLRGDDLDVRADIYSVGATLYTLLTGRAPFEGDNAVQVVANAVNKAPKPLNELRDDLPPGLQQAAARCLAKEPEDRYTDYSALRNALLPFNSRKPEPASMNVRGSAGWIDYLIAFLPIYILLMLLVGNKEFHFRLFIDRTFYSARYYITFLSFGFLYFSIVEGIWGAGLGKRLKGLIVVRRNGRPPGMGRALIRILIQILLIEIVRIPILMSTFTAASMKELTWPQLIPFIAATMFSPWIPAILAMLAHRKNEFTTFWDFASGTRVVIKPKGTLRPSIKTDGRKEGSADNAGSLGPYRITEEIVPGEWIAAVDPVLRRKVWLLRRTSPELSLARRNLARSGRSRWLQKVETAETIWDAFEASDGTPFTNIIKGGNRLPWGTLRHWLHDLASELWAAAGDQTLPDELSLDYVWITSQGNAVLLDRSWPEVKNLAELIPVGDVAGQQRFLNSIAACADSTSLPLYARPVLNNLKDGKFEKLSFLTGTLRGLLDKPTDVGRGIRAGSIFTLPLYVCIMIFVGFISGLRESPRENLPFWCSFEWITMISAASVLCSSALIQLFTLPFRYTCSHAIFRLAVINDKGEPAAVSQLFVRWAVVWLPLLLPMGFAALLLKTSESVALICAFSFLFLWINAVAFAVVHPNRGLHDRVAGTWVVRC